MTTHLSATFRALAAAGGLRRVILAYALYTLVEMAVWLAVVLFAYDAGGASLAAAVAVVQLIPAAVLSTPLAGLADHASRGRALAAAHGAVMLSVLVTGLAMLVRAPTWLVVGASAAATAAIAVVRPVHFAALPHLARTPDDLVSANALSSVADGVACFAGPALAGFATAWVGPWSVFAGSALAGVAATSACLGLGLAAPPAAEQDRDGGWRGAVRGLTTLGRDGATLALLGVLTTDFIVAGALDVLGISYSQTVLGQGESGAGLLIGAVGIGGLAGALIGGSLSRRRSLAPVVLAGAITQGCAIAALALLGSLLPAVAVLSAAGLGGALLTVAGRTLLQRATDDRVLARVFAVQEGASLIGLASGAAVAPALIQWLSPAGAFVPLGLGTAGLCLMAVVLVRRLDRRSLFLPVELGLLRGVPFLAVLAPPELERLAHSARWLHADRGAVVVRQGEPGELFHIVAEGLLEVDVDGVRRPDPLAAGDGFGEIALVHAVPRTATVTASTPARLLTLRAEDFLAAVTGSVDGHRLAHEVSADHLSRDGDTSPSPAITPSPPITRRST